jgi:hypothetical protein
MEHPVERPAWADGEEPWVVDEVVAVGGVQVPGGRVGGGGPFLIGGEGGRPSWEIEVGAERPQVRVVEARHPRHGRDCGALQLVADANAGVARWAVIPTTSGRHHYTVEVGVASVGAVEAYASGLIFEQQMDFAHQPTPAWAGLHTNDGITMVLCSVGPQHQQCRTYAGMTADGRIGAIVTNLGLLDLDLER